MSRWAEMFAQLSQPADTIDTSDTTPPQQRPTSNCVRSVKCVKPRVLIPVMSLGHSEIMSLAVPT